MKNILIHIIFIGIVGGYATNTNANEGKTDRKVEVKCHIELYGGGDSIYYQVISEKKMNTLPMTIVNRNIDVVTSSKKQKVFKVNECVPINKDFSSKLAREKEKNTPR